MPRVVLQTAGNKPARRNYRESIQSPVPLERVEPHVSSEILAALKDLYPAGECWEWGTTPGRQNASYYAQMSPDDIVLFYRRRRLISAMTITLLDPRNESLALELLGWEDEEERVTFENIYFVTQPRSIDIAWSDVWAVTDFGWEDRLLRHGCSTC